MECDASMSVALDLIWASGPVVGRRCNDNGDRSSQFLAEGAKDKQSSPLPRETPEAVPTRR
jgi:hypothetical protein